MNSSLLTFLKQLKASGIERNIPNISKETGMFLNMLITIHQPKNILEIGCANGYSTIFLAEAAQRINAQVTTIDASAPSFAEAKEHIKKTGFSQNVEMIFGYGEEILPQLTLEKRTFDFIFVDAEKKKYKLFWELLQPLVSKKSVVIVDNVLKFPKKVQDFLDTISKDCSWKSVILPTNTEDGIMILINY